MGIKGAAKVARQKIKVAKNYWEHRNRQESISGPSLSNPKNVLILTIDCLRNDHLSRSGYARRTTPFLDSLSGSKAITAAPWTFSSVPSILTGEYPHTHGAVYATDESRNQDLSNPPHKIDDDVYTLAELLESSGFKTRFSTAVHTAALPVMGRFESLNIKHNVPATTLLADTARWWNETSGLKFSYVQLGDLHEPLLPPEELPFGSIPDIDGVDRWRFTESVTPKCEFDTYRQARVKLYDSILREVDRAIERFLDQLDELEDTVIVITSDHGEEFWEYRDLEKERFEDPRGIYGVGHGHALVPPVLEVPILSNSLSFNDNGFVSTIDIVPSVLSKLGSNDHRCKDGQLLSAPQRPVISQEIAYGPNQISVTDGESHLIAIPDRDEHFLLNYETGEVVNNLEMIDELMKHLPDDRIVGDEVSLTEGTLDHLEDLGYR